MKLKTQLFGKSYQFKDVKQVLAKANELRSGDVLAGVVAGSSQERVAAKQVLSEMTIADIRMNPVIPYEEDCVTRIIQDDINETAYARVKNWNISELREYILDDETSVDDIAFLRKGISSEVVAAVAKICSNADLIYGAKKMPVIKKANTTIGLMAPSAPVYNLTIPVTMCRVSWRKFMKGFRLGWAMLLSGLTL